MKTNERQLQLKVGIFVLAGIALTMTGILVLGGKQNFFTPVNHYLSHFEKVDGLVTGAKVALGGLQIGSVSHVTFDSKNRDMKVEFSVDREYSQFVRKDSTVQMVTQGVLGDKYLSITAGDPAQPPIPNGGEIAQGTSKDISQILSSSEHLMQRITDATDHLEHILGAFNKGNRADQFFQGMAETSKNLSSLSNRLNDELSNARIKSAMNHLDSILRKIDNGQGSMGAFINDPGLYDDAKALVGQVNRNRIMRNLIRSTIKENKEKATE